MRTQRLGVIALAMMLETATVTLESATVADAAVLSNLLELYIHDLSAAFPGVELGSDGRFGYKDLPLYWSQPERRFPFLIRCDGRVAGFVLATRGSSVSADPNVMDIAEFFVLRRYRRSSVGRRAAALLWTRLPGQWIVRVSEAVPGAAPFWRSVILDFTGGATTELERLAEPHVWRLFSFSSHQC
jgi:predicted acetyltransferase